MICFDTVALRVACSFMVYCRVTRSYLQGLASKASRPCAVTVDILCNLRWVVSPESYCWLHEWRAAGEKAVCATIQLFRGMQDCICLRFVGFEASNLCVYILEVKLAT